MRSRPKLHLGNSLFSHRSADTGTIPFLGTVGFYGEWIPIYGPNEGFSDPYGDPTATMMDWCFGHTGGDADYHYHGVSEECFNIPESTVLHR